MTREEMAKSLRGIADDIETGRLRDRWAAIMLEGIVAHLTNDPRLELARQKFGEYFRQQAETPVEDVWETGKVE